MLKNSETPSGAMIGIGAVGIAEYMLSAFLPSVSYADVFKYVNLAEYMKVYPLFSKYHNLDFFDNPVNAMTVFRIVLPVVLVLLFWEMCGGFSDVPKQREDGEGREKTAVGSVLFRINYIFTKV